MLLACMNTPHNTTAVARLNHGVIAALERATSQLFLAQPSGAWTIARVSVAARKQAGALALRSHENLSDTSCFASLEVLGIESNPWGSPQGLGGYSI
jgi:hypothetical protein